MKTITAITAGDLVSTAQSLWDAGWKGDKRARPIDRSKPLIPSVIAAHVKCPLWVAIKVNHLLAVWSIGAVPFGQFDKL